VTCSVLCSFRMANWEYQSSDGAWHAMQSQGSSFLEEALLAFSTCQLTLGLDDALYVVDFVRMARRNLKSSQERPLRRQCPAGQPAVWEVMHDDWRLPSDARDQQRLETAYAAHTNCFIEVQGETYAIDLACMHQTNQKTGHIRNLRRKAILQPLSSPALEASEASCKCKFVVLVRHGQGTHNATKNYSIVDPPLTEKGISQAQSLRGHPFFDGCELLVVSPLQRAVQTAALIFGVQPVCRTVITAMHTERWSAKCDEGRPKAELLRDCPFVAEWEGWAELSKGIWWGTSVSDFAWEDERLPAFYDWLRAQPESKIVVVGHGGFFAPMAGKHLANCEAHQIEL